MTTYLDFEKPIAELESKIAELRHLPNSGDVDIAEEVMRLQDKVQKQLRAIYAKLTPWPKDFVNLRASRATDLFAQYPAHVAAAGWVTRPG